VNLLTLPPKRTVIVGSAHCTYLCKSNNATVPSCCCTKGPGRCESDSCGSNPEVVKMNPEDAVIICGRWKSNEPSPNEVKLQVREIKRHEGYEVLKGPISGNDIAVFKVKNASQQLKDKGLKPACLPKGGNLSSDPGVHAGWSNPPPKSYVEAHAKEYTPYYADFFKQWHYGMDIKQRCRDPLRNAITGDKLKHPSNSVYPAGVVCAKDFSKQSCFSQGESGSPLMVERGGKFHAEGMLSFVKGCDVFSFGTINEAKGNAQLNQQSENPAVYTKLGCYMNWIAEQYGMTYNGEADPSCEKSFGDPENSKEVCRITPSNLLDLFSGEKECIFPFEYKNVRYDKCILFEEDGFVYPIFRCPTSNVTTKTEDGINKFEFLSLVNGYCPDDPNDPNSPLNPDKDDCSPFARKTPWSQCKNNCPGVDALGVIGGQS